MEYQSLVLDFLEQGDFNAEKLKEYQRAFAKQNGMQTLPSKSQILQAYFQLVEEKKINRNSDFELLLRKRSIRSLSGIVSVQVLTKPYPCPSRCIFCPNDPDMPKSYIKSEPGAMRARLNQFDPIKQVYNRLYSLKQTGHKTDKIEMIVLGWTWDFYPRDYKIDFIKKLYDACNSFSQLQIESTVWTSEWKYGFKILNEDEVQLSNSLSEAITLNETAENRIIWLTIETTPLFVTEQNCKERREMGVTRIEMGVQSTNNTVLDLNQRGHHIQEVRKALHRMRQFGFKISIHIMPGLYGSNPEMDIQTFRDIYADPWLQPDEIKFYPTSVIPNTELYTLYLQGKYQPITTEEISHIIKTTFREIIPPYTRIKRLIRDIPATEIAAGSNVTNLSQLMHESLLKEYKKADSVFLSDFYKRLYPNLKCFNDQEAFYEGLKVLITENQQFLNQLPSEEQWDINFFSYPEEVRAQSLILGEKPDLEKYRHFVSLDTRSREMRNKTEETQHLNLVVRSYLSSVGNEFFISFEDELGYLYGFTRLLLPRKGKSIERGWLWENTALIRELHVYGSLQSIQTSEQEQENQKVQHTGIGRKLLECAERIGLLSGYQRLSVISGVGVREYYRKLGYQSEGTYVVKELITN